MITNKILRHVRFFKENVSRFSKSFKISHMIFEISSINPNDLVEIQDPFQLYKILGKNEVCVFVLIINHKDLFLYKVNIYANENEKAQQKTNFDFLKMHFSSNKTLELSKRFKLKLKRLPFSLTTTPSFSSR